MKKIIYLLFVCIALIFLLSSCDSASVGESTPSEDTTSARFQLIGKEQLANYTDDTTLEGAYYYVDRYTNIVYVYIIDWNGNTTRGMMTVLYNADGNPMTLTEFENEEK